MAGKLGEWWRGLFGARNAPASPPASEPIRRDGEPVPHDEEAEAVAGLRVEPRAKVLDFADLEQVASGPGFVKLRIAGIPAWADAIAKRRSAGEPMESAESQIDPAFDAKALLSCEHDVRLAIGPVVRNAIVEALVHSPAVRLGEGFAEAIVAAKRAGERPVQDAILTIARAFTGSTSIDDRIARWATEDESPRARRACLAWIVRSGKAERFDETLRAALKRETDAMTLLDLAAAIGAGAADVVERIAADETADPHARARAITMLPTVSRDDARVEELLLRALATSAVARDAALAVIVEEKRTAFGVHLVEAIDGESATVGNAIIRLGDPRLARITLDARKKDEPVTTTLERVRIAAELGGKECVEPLRMLLGAGNPRELASPVRAAIESVKARLVAIGGALSVSAPDDRGRLSPVGSMSGALSETSKKRG